LSNAAITVSRLAESKARRRTTGSEREEATWRQNKLIMKTFISYALQFMEYYRDKQIK